MADACTHGQLRNVPCGMCDLETQLQAARARIAELMHDITAYQAALGYTTPGDHDGRLTDGTVPQCGLCNALHRQLDEAQQTINSISYMLGWMNGPVPRETLERDIAALKAAATRRVEDSHD